MLRPIRPFKFSRPDDPGGASTTTDDFNVDLDDLGLMLGDVDSGKLDPDKLDPKKAIDDVKDEEGDLGDTGDSDSKGEKDKKDDSTEPAEEDTEEPDVLDHEARAAALEGIIEKMASDAPIVETKDDDTAGEGAEDGKGEFTTQPAIDIASPAVFVEPQDEEVFEDVLRDPEAYAKHQNDFGNIVMNKTLERTIVRLVPLLSQLVPKYFDLKFETEKFYAKNPELNRIRGYTGKVLNEVRQRHPKMSLSEQLEKTKKEVYEQLKLPGKHNLKNGNTKARKPKFAGPGSQTRPTDPQGKTETQEQMDDMLKVVA